MASVAQRPPVPAGYDQQNPEREAPPLSSHPRPRSPSTTNFADAAAASPSPTAERWSDALSRAQSRISGSITSDMRSQYPADGVENHVEYILVASFDIDRGSVMEHQYPGPISGDETMLAELMLPDQAHMRNQDWTVFFLHKDTSAEEEAKEERRQRRRRKRRKEGGDGEQYDQETGRQSEDADGDDVSDGTDDDDDDEFEGPPLVYVLNLVHTKTDNTVKRYEPLPPSI